MKNSSKTKNKPGIKANVTMSVTRDDKNRGRKVTVGMHRPYSECMFWLVERNTFGANGKFRDTIPNVDRIERKVLKALDA